MISGETLAHRNGLKQKNFTKKSGEGPFGQHTNVLIFLRARSQLTQAPISTVSK